MSYNELRRSSIDVEFLDGPKLLMGLSTQNRRPRFHKAGAGSDIFRRTHANYLSSNIFLISV